MHAEQLPCTMSIKFGVDSSSLDTAWTQIKTKFEEQAFSYTEPAAWNRLPHDIHASTSLNVFKWKMKTHLFAEAFSY